MALKNLPYLFDHVIPNLKHENDGLIFTPVKLPYIPGTCRQLYLPSPLPFPPLAPDQVAHRSAYRWFLAISASSGSPIHSTALTLSSRSNSGDNTNDTQHKQHSVSLSFL